MCRHSLLRHWRCIACASGCGNGWCVGMRDWTVSSRNRHWRVTESDRLWSVTVVTFLIVSPLSRSPETVAVTETVSPPWTRTASWQHVMRHRRQIRLWVFVNQSMDLPVGKTWHDIRSTDTRSRSCPNQSMDSRYSPDGNTWLCDIKSDTVSRHFESVLIIPLTRHHWDQTLWVFLANDSMDSPASPATADDGTWHSGDSQVTETTLSHDRSHWLGLSRSVAIQSSDSLSLASWPCDTYRETLPERNRWLFGSRDWRRVVLVISPWPPHLTWHTTSDRPRLWWRWLRNRSSSRPDSTLTGRAAQELCESRGGRPGILSRLISLRLS